MEIMNDDLLDKWERLACANDSQIHQIASRLLSEVRKLKHELVDPRFMYAGGRVPRQAIVCRNEEIDRLQNKLREATEGGEK